jgi:uncharacterized protein
MRYFAAIPLALLVTSTALASEAAFDRVLLVRQDIQAHNSFSDFMTGLDFYNGWGETPQNYLEAMKFFELAAHGGHNQAQHYLGFMYYKGLGVTKDNIEAYKWFYLAASNGDKVGIVLKITLKELLSDQEIIEAESRAQEWLHTADLQ